MLTENYNSLIKKLDEFIRKYYTNKLIKGLLYTIGAVLAFYLAIAVSEYYGHFNSLVRTFLFYSFLVINAIILYRLILIPLFKIYHLGKTISHQQAAEIIGKHFSNVKDKLLNVLQLKEQITNEKDEKVYSNFDLIEASISQKINELKPIPFVSAINLSQNRKYLKYAVAPILLFFVLIFSAPSIIKESTHRLVKHDDYFEPVAPFQFIIGNKKLQAVQQEDFLLNVEITGNEIPSEVFVEIDGNQFKLDKEKITAFSYLFRNIQKSIFFKFYADGFYSKEYKLEALPNPIVLDFEVELNYPKYLNKRNEVLKNTGDLLIPAGTKASWNFNTEHTNLLQLAFNDTVLKLNPVNTDYFQYGAAFFKNDVYSISTANEYLKNNNSIQYVINVIPDLFPTIKVEQYQDSVTGRQLFFSGEIKDDYGFSKLTFNYTYKAAAEEANADGNTKEQPDQTTTVPLSINKSVTINQFTHAWNTNSLNIAAGDEIEYYFEVWDNDGVSGSKSTRSQKFVFQAPTLAQVEEKAEKNNQQIKDNLQQGIDQAKKLQQDVKDLNKKLMDKKSIGWEEKKKIQDLLDQQKELQNKVDEIKQENSKNNMMQQEFSKEDENIMEKKKQLEDLFEQVMTDEMKEMLKELEKMMDKMDKSKAQEMIDKMKLSNKDIEKELDRSLEIFKQLEFEQKLESTKNKLDELAKKQEELSQKSLDKKADNKALEEKQNELKKEFDEVKKDIDELNKKNSELENPNNMVNTEREEQNAEKEMSNSKESLQNNKNKNASDSQKKAAESMQDMANMMDKMQEDMQSEEQGEDLAKLREILENLLRLSFKQEDLMNQLKETSTNNPKYLQVTQEQKNLKDDSQVIEDSLFALSKRVAKISSFVNREISAINMNMEKAIENLAERQTPQALNRQQYVMTSVNNLALLLSEVVKQMQEEMAEQKQQGGKPGNKSCKKPGSGSPSVSSMKEMQKKLNQQMKEMKDKMGQNPGQGKKGQAGGMGGMSQELAKAAAQQEAIRNYLQELNQKLNKNGQGSMGDLENLAKMMEQTETDLVNKTISQETLKRQQDILTRLLEAEKAEREREMDEKRKSDEAKSQEYNNPSQFQEYIKLKEKETELLQTVPIDVNSFYKKKISEYFNNFEK